MVNKPSFVLDMAGFIYMLTKHISVYIMMQVSRERLLRQIRKNILVSDTEIYLR